VVGQHALANGQMRSYYQKYEANPFIEIGNHSYSHAHGHYKKFYSRPDSVIADFFKNVKRFYPFPQSMHGSRGEINGG